MAAQPVHRAHAHRLQPNELIDQVIYTQRILQQETDLSPRNPLITETLSSFVANVLYAEAHFSEHDKQEVLDNAVIRALKPQLLKGLSQAEYEMELFFSDKFLQNPNFEEKNLEEFWYLQNYIDLVDLELEKMPLDNMQGREIVFIGSGPLPLTAIIMGQKTGLNITCLDMDAAAIERGRILTDKLGMAEQIHFTQRAGHAYNFKDSALVMIASLVDDKGAVLHAIENTAETLPKVAMRSATGLHALLYDPVTPSILDDFNMCVQNVTRQTPDVINTTIVCKFKPKFK